MRLIGISGTPRLLYLLEREDGAFKVGSSSFPAQRMLTVENEQGFDFQVVQEWTHPLAWDVEMEVHRALRRHKEAELAEFGGVETYIVAKPVVLKVIRDVLTMWRSDEEIWSAYDKYRDIGEVYRALGLYPVRLIKRALARRPKEQTHD